MTPGLENGSRIARGVGSTLVAAAVVVVASSSVTAEHPEAGTAGDTTEVPGSVDETVRGEIGRRMDELARRAAVFGFSGQVLVESDGEVVLHRAYGHADPGSGRRMRLDTPIGVASVSKQFAAAAVLALVEDGHLSLRDSLPLFFDGVPEAKTSVTLHHLLTHTSGVQSAYTEDFEPDTREELLTGILDTASGFEPGTRWSYSAAGYNLVAAIVEEVTGRSYGDALRDLLFAPAGLERTGLLGGGPWSAGAVARAHVGWIDRGSPDVWPRNWRNFGAGDVVTTVAELYRWDHALRSERVLSRESVDRMRAVQHETGGDAGYGYGFFVHRPEGGPVVVEHGGDAALGYNASYYRYPDEGHLVLITSNIRTPQGQSLRHALGIGLEQLLRGERAELPPEATLLERERLDHLAGTYRMNPTADGRSGDGRFHLVSDGAHLWLTASGQPALDLLEGSCARPSTDASGRTRVEAGEGESSGLRRANAKTRRLLEQLLVRADSAAYAEALTEDGAPHLPDYLWEWRRLVESRGPFQGFRLMGSRPFGRSAVSTVARLRFRDGTATMSYLWRDEATGRLAGTFVYQAAFRPPLGLAVGRRPRGGFVAHDPVGGTTVRFRVELQDGSPMLRFEAPDGCGSTEARRTGLAGWTPPFGG